jgi:hypothetical protein
LLVRDSYGPFVTPFLTAFVGNDEVQLQVVSCPALKP